MHTESKQQSALAGITPGPYSEIGTYGLTRFEITANSERVAVFDRIEDARAFRALPDLIAALEGILGTDGAPVFITGSQADFARSALAKARGAQ